MMRTLSTDWSLSFTSRLSCCTSFSKSMMRSALARLRWSPLRMLSSRFIASCLTCVIATIAPCLRSLRTTSKLAFAAMSSRSRRSTCPSHLALASAAASPTAFSACSCMSCACLRWSLSSLRSSIPRLHTCVSRLRRCFLSSSLLRISRSASLSASSRLTASRLEISETTELAATDTRWPPSAYMARNTSSSHFCSCPSCTTIAPGPSSSPVSSVTKVPPSPAARNAPCDARWSPFSRRTSRDTCAMP
mmetsp:Transcript_10053/g.25709  ORF Transcript_10053/g.25709 Transcript_10053/m.25709 type:complete len:248 (+) Transcript_10053:1756-2499(+)